MATSIAREAATLARPALCPLCGTTSNPNIIALPGIRIDLTARRTWIAGTEITLSRKEFELLTYFAKRPGQAITKQQLYRDLWGYTYLPTTTRTADSHLSRLRSKMRHATGGAPIITCVWGVGWRLSVP